MKKFIIDFRLKPNRKSEMVDLFELQGPNRAAGVTFRSAWIGTRLDVVFVLCESVEETLVEQARRDWSEFGEYTIHPVIHHEQY